MQTLAKANLDESQKAFDAAPCLRWQNSQERTRSVIPGTGYTALAQE